MSRGELKNLPVHRYNQVVTHPSVKCFMAHAAMHCENFEADKFISCMAQADGFPDFAVSDLVAAAKRAKAPLSSARIAKDDLNDVRPPFFTYLESNAGSGDAPALIPVERLVGQTVVMGRTLFGPITMPREQFAECWTGTVLVPEYGAQTGGISKVSREYIDAMEFESGILSEGECAEVIDLCEKANFKRSQILSKVDGRLSGQHKLKRRSSSSVTLTDREHPVLKGLYRACAEREGVSSKDIEAIQCVRYKRNQKFNLHQDASIGVPRMTTYLLYLNNDFTGGETYFPIVDQLFRPETGAWLRFPNGDRDGRISWLSDHGGLPVKNGTKYALNIWIRTHYRDELHYSGNSTLSDTAGSSS